MAEPVFYDPRRARWKRLRRLVDITAVFVSALIIFFVYTALRDEPLPDELGDLVDRCLAREAGGLPMAAAAERPRDRGHVELVDRCTQRHTPRRCVVARRARG